MSTFYVNSASIENLYVTDLTAITSSITYITSSQIDVGTNIIKVNTNTSPLRYGGIAVADSGSSPITSGSLLFDSVNNQWIFIHQNQISAPITSSVLIMGPQTFNDVGNEITIGVNRLTKGQAGDLGEHITSSNISDDGTTVSINSNSEITGSLHHLGTFYPNQIDWFSSSIGYNTGSYILTTTSNGLTTYANYQDVATVINNGLLTTSSFNAYTGSSTSQFAGTASYVMQSLSASYASTASYVKTAQTSSLLNGKLVAPGTNTNASHYIIFANNLSSSPTNIYTDNGLSYNPFTNILSTNVNLPNEVASRILSTDASKNIKSLDTTTYPDLTELSYVKGVTSALQTQLNGKEPTITNGYGISGTTTKSVSLTSTQVFATATTSINAATYIDITGCSVSLAAGTWLITGLVVGASTNTIMQGFVSIRDGSNNVIAAAAMSRPASGTTNLNSPISVSWSALVSPVSTTTYKLSAARGLTTHTATWTVYDGTGYNTTNHANNNLDNGTNILAIRIA